MSKHAWTWMPHPAHLIVAQDCRFHLATHINGWIISTVGEWLPDEAVREIHAQRHGIVLEGRGDYRRADFLKKCGFMEIGLNRTYETMVFKAIRNRERGGCRACEFVIANGEDLDRLGYADAKAATAGHMSMCEKWAKKRRK